MYKFEQYLQNSQFPLPKKAVKTKQQIYKHCLGNLDGVKKS